METSAALTNAIRNAKLAYEFAPNSYTNSALVSLLNAASAYEELIAHCAAQQSVIDGVEIALARDADIDGAMALIVAAKEVAK